MFAGSMMMAGYAILAGTPLFLVKRGYRAGPLQYWRYFQLLGFDKNEKREFVKSGSYGIYGSGL